MKLLSVKILAISLIILGEMLAIGAEMVSAKYPTREIKNLNILYFTIPLIIIAGIFLLFGYMLGYSSFKNIWIISAASITSILVIEPAIAFFIFREMPTTGAMLGLILGFIGFVLALFY